VDAVFKIGLIICLGFLIYLLDVHHKADMNKGRYHYLKATDEMGWGTVLDSKTGKIYGFTNETAEHFVLDTITGKVQKKEKPNRIVEGE
jgi:hypothetical protein